jgi:hypothetical protein
MVSALYATNSKTIARVSRVAAPDQAQADWKPWPSVRLGANAKTC